jgi:hypothetical protein
MNVPCFDFAPSRGIVEEEPICYRMFAFSPWLQSEIRSLRQEQTCSDRLGVLRYLSPTNKVRKMTDAGFGPLLAEGREYEARSSPLRA